MNITQFIVKENGSVNVDATMAKFKDALDSYIKSSSIDEDMIKNATMMVFQTTGKKMIQKTSLIDIVTVEIAKNDPAAITATRKAVSSWMADNTGSDNSKLFKLKLGPNGGISLWSDSE